MKKPLPDKSAFTSNINFFANYFPDKIAAIHMNGFHEVSSISHRPRFDKTRCNGVMVDSEKHVLVFPNFTEIFKQHFIKKFAMSCASPNRNNNFTTSRKLL